MEKTVETRSAVQLGINAARHFCKGTFDSHVILRVFQHFRIDPAAQRIYLATTGCATGFEENHRGKDVLNPLIAREIARHFDAEVVEVVDVEGEFIKSYSVLKSRRGARS